MSDERLAIPFSFLESEIGLGFQYGKTPHQIARDIWRQIEFLDSLEAQARDQAMRAWSARYAALMEANERTAAAYDAHKGVPSTPELALDAVKRRADEILEGTP